MLYPIDVFLSPKVSNIMQKIYDELRDKNLNPEDCMVSVELVSVTTIEVVTIKLIEAS